MSIINLLHGTDHIIEVPDIHIGNPHNDYGMGFYCTRVDEMAREWACKKSTDGFVNSYDSVTKPSARCNQPAESLGHILFGDGEVLPGGRETEHLILIKSNSEIKVIPLRVLYDHRCLSQIIQNIRDFSKQCFIGSEDLLRIE